MTLISSFKADHKPLMGQYIWNVVRLRFIFENNFKFKILHVLPEFKGKKKHFHLALPEFIHRQNGEIILIFFIKPEIFPRAFKLQKKMRPLRVKLLGYKEILKNYQIELSLSFSSLSVFPEWKSYEVLRGNLFFFFLCELCFLFTRLS